MSEQLQAEAELGPWMSSGRLEGEPPHRFPGLEVIGEAALFPVWGDRERSAMVGVEDYDGCFALIVRMGPKR